MRRKPVPDGHFASLGLVSQITPSTLVTVRVSSAAFSPADAEIGALPLSRQTQSLYLLMRSEAVRYMLDHRRFYIRDLPALQDPCAAGLGQAVDCRWSAVRCCLIMTKHLDLPAFLARSAFLEELIAVPIGESGSPVSNAKAHLRRGPGRDWHGGYSAPDGYCQRRGWDTAQVSSVLASSGPDLSFLESCSPIIVRCVRWCALSLDRG